MSSIYDEELDFDLEAWQNRYIMSPQLWAKFSIDDLDNVKFDQWKSFKLFNSDGTEFSDETKTIPTKFGGIYVYSISPGIIPDCGRYIMYVGMASKTNSENLRNRVNSYKKEIGEDFSRVRLHRLFKKWGAYVYINYLPVDSDRETIFELESRLIAALLPPCNADIRAKGVRDAVKAFR